MLEDVLEVLILAQQTDEVPVKYLDSEHARIQLKLDPERDFAHRTTTLALSPLPSPLPLLPSPNK